MPLDLSTLLVVTCAITALQGIVMLRLWQRQREAVWLPWRAVIFMLGGGFLFLFAVDDASLRQISIGLGTATFIAATFAVWSSGRVFNGKPVIWVGLIAALGIWAGISVLTDTLDSLLPAAIIQSLAGVAWIGGGAWEHWQARARGVRGQWGVIALYAAVALFFLIRLPFVAIWPFPFGGLAVDQLWLAIFVLWLDVAAILLTTVTLLSLRVPR